MFQLFLWELTKMITENKKIHPIPKYGTEKDKKKISLMPALPFLKLPLVINYFFQNWHVAT